MRVTDKMLFDRAGLLSGKARTAASEASEQAATGLRVRHPWDDAGAAGLIVGERTAHTRLRAIESTAARAHDEMVAADSALADVQALLNRGRELAVQLGNDTYSAAERRGVATEVDGLLRDAIIRLNVKVANRYIFGGFQDGSPPFADDATYQGDEGERQVEVAPGILEVVSLRADEFVKGVNGGVDVLQAFQDLAAALRGGDGDAIRASVNALDAGVNQLAEARARAGSKMNLLETAVSAAGLAQDQGTERLSKLQDADFIEAASRMALAQRALDAALTASAKSFSLTLLDKLR
jgi:flagellar hook-associated protein 3 FlgL